MKCECVSEIKYIHTYKKLNDSHYLIRDLLFTIFCKQQGAFKHIGLGLHFSWNKCCTKCSDAKTRLRSTMRQAGLWASERELIVSGRKAAPRSNLFYNPPLSAPLPLRDLPLRAPLPLHLCLLRTSLETSAVAASFARVVYFHNIIIILNYTCICQL